MRDQTRVVAGRGHLQRLRFTTTGGDASQVDSLLGRVLIDRKISQSIQCWGIIDGIDRDIQRAAERGIVKRYIQVTIGSAVFHCHGDRGCTAQVRRWSESQNTCRFRRCVRH